MQPASVASGCGTDAASRRPRRESDRSTGGGRGKKSTVTSGTAVAKPTGSSSKSATEIESQQPPSENLESHCSVASEHEPKKTSDDEVAVPPTTELHTKDGTIEGN